MKFSKTLKRKTVLLEFWKRERFQSVGFLRAVIWKIFDVFFLSIFAAMWSRRWRTHPSRTRASGTDCGWMANSTTWRVCCRLSRASSPGSTASPSSGSESATWGPRPTSKVRAELWPFVRRIRGIEKTLKWQRRQRVSWFSWVFSTEATTVTLHTGRCEGAAVVHWICWLWSWVLWVKYLLADFEFRSTHFTQLLPDLSNHPKSIC